MQIRPIQIFEEANKWTLRPGYLWEIIMYELKTDLENYNTSYML